MKKHILNRKIGIFGESAAAKYLENRGYSILERNYRNKMGEIDIVCKKDNILHAVEVKTVFNVSKDVLIRPEDHLDARKIKKVVSLASLYLLENNFPDSTDMSVDGILIKLFGNNVKKIAKKGIKEGAKGSIEDNFPKNIQKVFVTHIKNINVL